MILSPGQTGVLDRGYQAHDLFDQWQDENKHFVCRIKASTKKTCIETNIVNPDRDIFYDAIVFLGTPGINQTKKPARVVGYTVDGINYWVARSRYGLTVQILAGLITYLLLAIYCREQYNEKVSIQRVRQLRIKIQNELRADTGGRNLWPRL